MAFSNKKITQEDLDGVDVGEGGGATGPTGPTGATGGSGVDGTSFTPAEDPGDSEATDVAGMVADYNALLASMRTAGQIA